MTQSETLTKTASDGFSLRRMAMVARYYWPVIRWEAIGFPILSVVCSLLSLAFIMGHAAILASLTNSICSYAVGFAPLVLLIERRRSYQMSLSLPAANAEKALFLILFFCVAVPVIVFVPSALILHGIDYQDMLADMPNIGKEEIGEILLLAKRPEVFFSGVVMSFGITLTTLWVMVSARRNVVVKGIVIPLAVYYGTALLVCIVFCGYMFKIGLEAGTSDTLADTSEVMKIIVDGTIRMCFALIAVGGIYAMFAAVMTWRAVAKRQI